MPSGLVPSTVFKENFWAFLGPCVWGTGRPWYGTSAQPKSHFTCSSLRCAPWVVPSTFLLNYFWAFLWAWGGAKGRPWYGTFAKSAGHFTEGMFEKSRPWPPGPETPPPPGHPLPSGQSPEKFVYVYVPFPFLKLSNTITKLLDLDGTAIVTRIRAIRRKNNISLKAVVVR